jgi:hypothetical protein
MKPIPAILILLFVILLAFSGRKSADDFAQQYGRDHDHGKGEIEARLFNRGPYWYAGRGHTVYHVRYEDGTEAYFYMSLSGYQITLTK